MKKQIRQKFNRTLPKCTSSKLIKSPNLTPKNSKSKPTTPNSDGAYFTRNKPRLPKEIEEESEKEKFIKKFGGVI